MKTRNSESGYALLLVFCMAAIVAISLYMEIPRVAFEAQRDKEQLLMDHGQEYARAIALFVHKFNRFPASIDELQNTNNIRFLRRAFTDPMTGKADWRMLHAGPGGVITDSVVQTAKGASGGTGSSSNFITLLGPMTGSVAASDAEGVNLATRRRASDQAGAPGDPNGGLGMDPGNSPSASAGNSGSGYNGPVMVLPDGTIVPANSTGMAPPPVAQGNNPGIPGAPGVPGQSAGGPLPTGVAIQQSFQGGQQNGQNGPGQPAAPPNSAASLINQILTTPRPGGLNGTQGPTSQPSQLVNGTLTAPQQQQQPQQQIIGAGLAGVASKREQEGIKSYNNRTKYNEWEFIYDVTKDPSKMGQQNTAVNGAQGASGAAGNPAGMGFGQSGAGSPFGTSSPGATPPGGSLSPGTTGH